MQVVTAREMARIEQVSYADGASEEAFMEAAGLGVADYAFAFLRANELPHAVYLLAGKGNNGGDAYVAGRYLLSYGCDVIAWQCHPIEESSPLCRQQQAAFLAKGGVVIDCPDEGGPTFPHVGVIVDGLFGTGFSGQVGGRFAQAIRAANVSGLPIISIDIPSGLSGNDGCNESAPIKALATASLGLPKCGLFLGEAWGYVGALWHIDFGLGSPYSDSAIPEAILLNNEWAHATLPPLKVTRHKYEAGYVAGLAGSKAMPGAALMASLAALRAGAGVCRLLYTQEMEAALIAAPWELLRQCYDQSDSAAVLTVLNSANAAFVGPGLGRERNVGDMLAKVLPSVTVPMVVDADALYWLAERVDIVLPKGTVLTPHSGEMSRLVGQPLKGLSPPEQHALCQEYCDKRECVIVMKGAPTWIFSPHAVPKISIRGNPGMATAGAGDVLTGMIASLLAQGLPPVDAAALGAYLHGRAGEAAAASHTPYGIIATDLIDSLGVAFSACMTQWQKIPAEVQ